MGTVVWGAGSGGGSDGKWSTVANWTSDTKPIAGDDVVFNAVGDAFACLVDEAYPALASLTINVAYTKTVTLGISETSTCGTFTCAGAFTTSNYAFICGSFTTATGGVFTANGAILTSSGNWDTTTVGTFIYGTSTIVFTGSADLKTETCDFVNANVCNITVSAGTLSQYNRIGLSGAMINNSVILSKWEQAIIFLGLSATPYTGSGTIPTLYIRFYSAATMTLQSIICAEIEFHNTVNCTLTGNLTVTAGAYSTCVLGESALLDTDDYSLTVNGCAYFEALWMQSATTTLTLGASIVSLTTSYTTAAALAGTTNAGSATITSGGRFDTSGGVFNCGTSTVSMTGTGSVKLNASYPLYNVQTSGSVTITSASDIVVTGTFTVAVNGTWDTDSTSNYALTVTGTITLNKALLCNGSAIIATGGFNIGAAGYMVMGTSAISSVGHFANNSTSASWSAGTTSTINFNGTLSQTLNLNGGNSANISYKNITISNSGVVNVVMGANTLTITGLLNCSTTTATIKCDTNNPNLTISGGMTLANGCTFTKGSGTLTFNGNGTITDSNAISQDLGVVSNVSAITMSSGIQVTTLTLINGSSWNCVAQTLLLGGNITFNATSTFICGSGTVVVTNTSTITDNNVGLQAWCNLTINATGKIVTLATGKMGSITGILRVQAGSCATADQTTEVGQIITGTWNKNGGGVATIAINGLQVDLGTTFDSGDTTPVVGGDVGYKSWLW